MALELNGNYSPSERIVSPGVFTREIDQSYLAQGVAAIGGVVVAPFPKGPGFSPTVISNETDLTNMFGTPDGTLYGPYTAQQYIRQQGQVTVCRVGGLAGYEQQQALIISAIPGQYGRFIETGSFTGSVAGATGTFNETSASVNGAFNVTGSIIALFLDGVYSGSRLVVGDFKSAVRDAVTGSGGYLSTGTVTASLTDSTLPHSGSSPIYVKANLWISSPTGCSNQVNLSGQISGSYGALNSASWAPWDITREDGCGNITGSTSGSRDETVLAVLANTALDTGQNLYGFSGSVLTPVYTVNSRGQNVIGSGFTLTLNEAHLDSSTNVVVSQSYGVYNLSLDVESNGYLTHVFGTDPKAGFVPIASGQKVEAAYTYKHFDNRTKEIINEMLNSGSWKIQVQTRDALTFEDGITPDVGTSLYDLTNASTPFIRSQMIASFSGSGPATPAAYDLFKVHTLSDGTDTNTAYKVEIANVKSPGSIQGTDYGSFALIVRAYSDSDVRTTVLERFDNLNLDPGSSNYVARRIGDMYNYIDFNGKIMEFGDYNNVSKLVRVEMAISPIPVTAIPFGFGPYAAPIGGDYARTGKVPVMQYTSASVYAAQPGRYASGVVFQAAPTNADADLAALYPYGSTIAAELDNKQYFAPVPQGSSVASNTAFDLEGCGVTPLYVAADEATNVKKRRFVLGFQGGFDGMSPSVPVLVGNDILPTNQQGLDCSTGTSRGTYGYRQALAALSNADEFDFNLITTPGINYQDHAYVSSLTDEVCTKRGDAFYIMDIAPNQNPGEASIANVVELAGQFDTNYSGVYYPWVKIVDSNSNKVIAVPPSVVMMGVYAANDAVAAEWFAPAGLNRGGIPAAVQVVDRLTHSERDTLYEGKVNPIAAFPGQGIVAWGQKTLQRNPSALDRINVRRLLIAVKKFIAGSSRFLTFEQNVSTTRQRFLNIVNPYLEGVQQRSGIYSFKVKMDAENNTPDVVDRNILYGQIMIQPAKTSEYILLDFQVSATGATFSS